MSIDSASLRELTRSSLAHDTRESFEHALSRLRQFARSAQEAGLHGSHDPLVVSTGKPLTREQLAELETALGIALPASLEGFLLKIGGLDVRGPNLRLSTSTTADALDFDTDVGQAHDSAYYADVYGLDEEAYDWDTVEQRFARVSLANLYVGDDNAHEDGDVVTVIIDREEPDKAKVWEIPHDDGYTHDRHWNDVGTWFSYVVDRVIRASYLIWSGIHDGRELEDPSGFDDQLHD
jgi:hypothetical protein